MKKLIPFILVAVFFGCAPRVYRYNDKNGNAYSVKIKSGAIIDTSFVRNSAGEPLEIFVWKTGDKHYPKDTVFFEKENPPTPDVCKDSLLSRQTKLKCKRSTEEILSTVRFEATKLRKIYNKFLETGNFRGVITIRFVISPSGEIKYNYLVGETTYYKDFVMEVIQNVDKWEFVKIDGNGRDIVSVPLIFSTN